MTPQQSPIRIEGKEYHIAPYRSPATIHIKDFEHLRARSGYEPIDETVPFNKRVKSPSNNHYQERRAAENSAIADIDAGLSEAKRLSDRGSRNSQTNYEPSDPRLDRIVELGAKLKDQIMANEFYLDALDNPDARDGIIKILLERAS